MSDKELHTKRMFAPSTPISHREKLIERGVKLEVRFHPSSQLLGHP